VVVLAAKSPADCFATAVEAFRLAIRYMTPVFMLTDGYLANGSEPWRIPEADESPAFDPPRTASSDDFQPYARDPVTLARAWVVPGTPGMEHTVGGLEKQDVRGTVSYESANHERMVNLRIQKIRGVVKDVPPLEVSGPGEGELLVLGWGSTYGAIYHAVRNAQKQGKPVAAAHLKYLNPFPENLGEILLNYRQVLIPELNAGQLRLLIRAEYLVDAVGLNKVTGQPFRTDEIEARITVMLGGGGATAADVKARNAAEGRGAAI
jgi:2-oxoglutarate ferredoxin oxidoreductase subunit alpha